MIKTLKRLTTLLTLVGITSTASAYVPEKMYEKYQATHADALKQQSKDVDQKLAQLEEKYGKKPNIIYILADDIGWGELGSYGGGKVMGRPSPNLDKLAHDGMKFLSFYAEPICTPTRASLMTGRLSKRSGMDIVLFPGQSEGLSASEYTLAQLLSDVGYSTAMFGKWHLGERDEHQPTNHGFDYAFYTLYNGGAWPWAENAHHFDASNETIGEIPYNLDSPKDYYGNFGIKVRGIMEAKKGDIPHEVAPLSLERYNIHDDELTDKILTYIEDKADDNNPFFVYYASNANQVFYCPPEHRTDKYVDTGNCQASQLAQHDENVGKIVAKLKDLGIAENTLVVWMSDNGPMYDYFPSAGYSWLKGKKGDAYEGGVRVPAMAYWPGMIEPGQDPIDMVQVVDMFTTAARIGGGFSKIPNDRVTDGIDQTALLFGGEGLGHRNYMYIYGRGSDEKFKRKNMVLSAVRYEDIKYNLVEGYFYNIVRDPGEKHFRKGSYLWASVPLNQMRVMHEELMEKYPNFDQPRASQPSSLTYVPLKAE